MNPDVKNLENRLEVQQENNKYYFNRMMNYSVLIGGIKGLIRAYQFTSPENLIEEIDKLINKFEDIDTREES